MQHEITLAISTSPSQKALTATCSCGQVLFATNLPEVSYDAISAAVALHYQKNGVFTDVLKEVMKEVSWKDMLKGMRAFRKSGGDDGKTSTPPSLS